MIILGHIQMFLLTVSRWDFLMFTLEFSNVIQACPFCKDYYNNNMGFYIKY